MLTNQFSKRTAKSNYKRGQFKRNKNTRIKKLFNGNITSKFFLLDVYIYKNKVLHVNLIKLVFLSMSLSFDLYGVKESCQEDICRSCGHLIKNIVSVIITSI